MPRLTVTTRVDALERDRHMRRNLGIPVITGHIARNDSEIVGDDMELFVRFVGSELPASKRTNLV